MPRPYALVPLILLFATACAHSGDPPPDFSDLSQRLAAPPDADAASDNSNAPCTPLNVDGPDEAADVVVRACQRFAEVKGLSPSAVDYALGELTVQIIDERQSLPCSGDAPGCGRIRTDRAKIYVQREGWRQYLPNVIYRILLVRFEEVRTTKEENRRLHDLSLCRHGQAC